MRDDFVFGCVDKALNARDNIWTMEADKEGVIKSIEKVKEMCGLGEKWFLEQKNDIENAVENYKKGKGMDKINKIHDEKHRITSNIFEDVLVKLKYH